MPNQNGRSSMVHVLFLYIQIAGKIKYFNETRDGNIYIILSKYPTGYIISICTLFRGVSGIERGEITHPDVTTLGRERIREGCDV